MTANVLSLVALIAIILVRVINLKDNTKKQETDKAQNVTVRRKAVNGSRCEKSTNNWVQL